MYRSSETSTNQSDIIIGSDDRSLNLVVDSDSIVSKIYMLNFVLWLGFFSVSILTKILQFYPSWVFLPSWQTSGNFVQAYFWHSVNRQYTYLTSLLFIYFPESFILYQVLHMENDLLFCSKLMFTNGKIVDCKYIIWFYSNFYFCQTHIWTSLLFIYLYQVLHIWKTIFCFVLF